MVGTCFLFLCFLSTPFEELEGRGTPQITTGRIKEKKKRRKKKKIYVRHCISTNKF